MRPVLVVCVSIVALSVVLACGSTSGTSCPAKDNGDGTKTISCPDVGRTTACLAGRLTGEHPYTPMRQGSKLISTDMFITGGGLLVMSIAVITRIMHCPTGGGAPSRPSSPVPGLR